MRYTILLLLLVFPLKADPCLYWWQPHPSNPAVQNFGDDLSRVIVERLTGSPATPAKIKDTGKLLAVGSILQFAQNHDIVWGSGIHGKHLKLNEYRLKKLDVRAVRGPLTRVVLKCLGFMVPEVYGDPALLLPILFPEFKPNPKREYIVIPHLSELHLFPPSDHVVYPHESWDQVVQKVIESKLVISSSLHGIIVAEAFGIPARWLRVTENEPEFKYHDYYLGTGREKGQFARSVKEALEMGGEKPAVFDPEALLNAFPYDYFALRH